MKKIMSALLSVIMCLAICQNMALAGTLNGTEYVNEEYGYKIIFPESWNGYISVKEYEGIAGVGICFEGKSNTSKENPYKEFPLFSVNSQSEVDADRDILDSIEKVGTVAGVNYYHTTGTGVADCYLYLYEKVLSNDIANNDVALAQEDLKMQQKIMSEATQVRVVGIDNLNQAYEETEIKETEFQVPEHWNSWRLDSVLTEFEGCTYMLYGGVLKRYTNGSTDGENLLYNVSNFITNNKIIYYTSWEMIGIYEYDVTSKNIKKVYSGDATSVIGCLDNQYLYYYLYNDMSEPEYSTWVLDLQDNQTRMIIDNNTISFYVNENNVFYAPFSGDNTSTDLYVCELDGSNKRLLIPQICEFSVFDNQIYYAACDFDYGSSLADFHIMRCNLDGSSAVKISEVFNGEYINVLEEDGVVLWRNGDYEKIPYNIPQEIIVTIDGKKVEFDQPPIIVDDRTLVPVRAIFEALGATVEWDGATQTVTSTKGETTISMTIGKMQMYKNGTLITLDVPPQLVSDRTLVPARAVAESFGCTVDWDGDNQTVIITKAK